MEYLLDWVRASTRVLSVVCGVRRQEIVVSDRNGLFRSADYNMIKNIARAGSVTTSSAGNCLQPGLHLQGWLCVCSCSSRLYGLVSAVVSHKFHWID